jgi:hypothetical protein
MSAVQIPNMATPPSQVEDEKKGGEIHHSESPYGLSEAQKTLAAAGEVERAKSLGTFTAIKYYWVAFLWSQYCSVGAVLVGYDGTVSK